MAAAASTAEEAVESGGVGRKRPGPLGRQMTCPSDVLELSVSEPFTGKDPVRRSVSTSVTEDERDEEEGTAEDTLVHEKNGGHATKHKHKRKGLFRASSPPTADDIGTVWQSDSASKSASASLSHKESFVRRLHLPLRHPHTAAVVTSESGSTGKDGSTSKEQNIFGRRASAGQPGSKAMSTSTVKPGPGGADRASESPPPPVSSPSPATAHEQSTFSAFLHRLTGRSVSVSAGGSYSSTGSAKADAEATTASGKRHASPPTLSPVPEDQAVPSKNQTFVSAISPTPAVDDEQTVKMHDEQDGVVDCVVVVVEPPKHGGGNASTSHLRGRAGVESLSIDEKATNNRHGTGSSPSPVWFDSSSYDLQPRSAFFPNATEQSTQKLPSHSFLASEVDHHHRQQLGEEGGKQKNKPGVHEMEQSLLELMDRFRSGHFRALGSETMKKMQEIRAKQERLTKLHFDLYAQENDQPLQPKEDAEPESELHVKLADAMRDLQKTVTLLSDPDPT